MAKRPHGSYYGHSELRNEGSQGPRVDHHWGKAFESSLLAVSLLDKVHHSGDKRKRKNKNEREREREREREWVDLVVHVKMQLMC